MLGRALRKCRFRISKLGRRVDQLWNYCSDPILVCVLETKHSISCDRENVELVVSPNISTINYKESDRSGRVHLEHFTEITDGSKAFAERVLSLGITQFGSVSSGMFDGPFTRIAVRDLQGQNYFTEYSFDTPQSEVRSMLLELARPTDQDAEQVGEVNRCPAVESSLNRS